MILLVELLDHTERTVEAHQLEVSPGSVTGDQVAADEISRLTDPFIRKMSSIGGACSVRTTVLDAPTAECESCGSITHLAGSEHCLYT